MRRLMSLILVLPMLLAWASPLWGQTYTEQPPQGLREKGTAIEWLMVAVFLVASLIVAFKPAKRANLR